MIINSTPSNVTWFSSAQSSMPSINSMDENGIIKILDACLVNGGIERSVLSVTIDGNNVTLDFGSGHGFNLYQIIYISGADDALINGNHKVIDMTNNTATIEVVGALVDTGVIKAKIAPLGYESIFGTTDPLKRAYRSLAASSAKRVLYLDMSYPDGAGYHATSPARRAMVDVCEDMQTLGVQINSYTSAINNKPTNKNGSLFWYQSRDRSKATAISTADIPWVVVGNGDYFYLCIAWSQYSSHANQGLKDVYAFGEFLGISETTLNNTILMAHQIVDDADTSLYTGMLGGNFSTVQSGTLVPTYVLAGSVLKPRRMAIISGSTTQQVYSGLTGAPYPSTAGNFLFTQIPKILGDDGGVIGLMPSLLFIDHTTNGTIDSEVIDGVLMVRVQQSAKTSAAPANVGFYVGV